MRTLAIINQKGGCGKTTTAINLGASLGKAGLRTLLVDMDPQSHCAVGLGIPESRIERDISDLLVSGIHTEPGGETDQGQLVWEVGDHLDLIPSRVKLAGLAAAESAFSRTERRERALVRALDAYRETYDVCLIDCPPSIGLLTFNALVAADLVIVPVETGFFSLQGAARQITTVRAVSKRLNTTTQCLVLPTLHEPGLAVADDLLIELRRRFESTLLPVTIHRDNALREAASFGQPITDYAPRSSGAHDYASLASILMECYDLGQPSAGNSQDRRDSLDWAAFESANAAPIPRPSQRDASNTPRPKHEPVSTTSSGGDDLMLHGDLPASGMITSVTIEPHGPPQPTMVVSIPTGHIHSPTPSSPPSTRNRSEELAQLAQRAGSQSQPKHEPGSVPMQPTRAAPPGSTHSDRPPGGAVATRTPPIVLPFPPDARHRLGAHQVKQGVAFVQPAALGKEVAIAGDFNRWKPIPLALNTQANTHELCLALGPGRHEYRLIVDGHWIADPYNTEWSLNSRGEPHSVLQVEAPRDHHDSPEIHTQTKYGSTSSASLTELPHSTTPITE